MKQNMRIALGQMQELTHETMTFAKQLGVTSVQLNTPNIPGEHCWSYEDLHEIKKTCDDNGLFLESIENVPIRFYDRIMLGLPGRDEQIENYCTIIRHMGRAGIPVLGHHFMPNFVWRTSSEPGRGGALCTAFDLDVAANGVNQVKYPANREVRIADESVMWDNYTYFLNAVLPVAEESGVRLALHPDDPPVAMLDGTARIFYQVDNFKKAEAIANSDAWGLNLCLGCCSEMVYGAANVMEMIRYFGPRNKICYVHFRDVQGTMPKFQECFLGEGNYHPGEVLRELKRSGFTGFLMDDHVPAVINDSPWGHRARAHAVGYMQGLLNALELME